MTILPTRVTSLVLSSMFVGVSAASAQAFDGFAGQMAMINMQHSVLQRSIGNQVRSSPASSTISNTSNLTFRTQMSNRRTNYASFIDRLRGNDPQGAAALEKLLASRDLVAEVGQGITHYGLRADNVADAYAVWWTQSWQAAHGDTSDPSRAAMQAVKAQAVRGIGSTPVFTNATDAMKQEFAETLLLQAALTSSYVDTYKNDPAMMRKMGDAVRKGAKASGLDLDSMTLTENGFVPSGKTGTADPESGAAEQALAANAVPAPVTPADHPPYILIAAAGGAGIGGVFLLGKAMGRRG